MKLISKLALGAGALIAVKGLDNRLETTLYEPEFKNLPQEFDGFKIAHISDLHSEIVPGLAEEIAPHKPDIIVVTGDMIHDDERPFNAILTLFERLLAIAPIYMVSGNHDLWNTRFSEFVRTCCDMGVHFCDDKMFTIDRDNAQIAIFGIRDPFGKATETIKKSLRRSLDALPEYDGFRLLLFHRANQFERLREAGFDLILTGHMHGGQFRIPGIGGVMPPKSSLIDSKKLFFPTYSGGAYRWRDTLMLVNRGLGNPMIIPRLFNRPEIGIIKLRCEN